MLKFLVTLMPSITRNYFCQNSGKQVFDTSYRFMSQTHSNAKPNHDLKKNWHLFSAVCLERVPRISADLNETEEAYSKLINQLEIENSLLSDHELRYREDKKIAAKKLEDDRDIQGEEEAARKTTAEIEDLWETEFNAFNPASRITKSDETNDVRSLERCLDSKLILLVKQKQGSKDVWLLPQGRHQPGESMRQTAERVLKEHCGESMKSLFVGNAPCGFFKYKYPTPSEALGAKVFFYRAFHQDGNVCETSPEIKSDYSWLNQNELQEYLSPDYLETVQKFFLDF